MKPDVDLSDEQESCNQHSGMEAQMMNMMRHCWCWGHEESQERKDSCSSALTLQQDLSKSCQIETPAEQAGDGAPINKKHGEHQKGHT